MKFLSVCILAPILFLITTYANAFESDVKTHTPQEFGAYGDGVHDDTQALANWAASTANGGQSYCPSGTYLTSETVVFNPINTLINTYSPTQTPPQTWDFDNHCIIRATAQMRAVVEFGSINPSNPYLGYIYNGVINGGVFDANFKAFNSINLIGYLDFTINNSTAKNAIARYLNKGDPNALLSAGVQTNNFVTLRDSPNVSIASITTGSTTTVTTTTPHGLPPKDAVVYLYGITGSNTSPTCTLAGASGEATSTLDCMEFQVTVTSPTTFTLDGVTTNSGDYISGGIVYLNFSGSVIPIPITNVSEASPAVITCATACNRTVGDQITIYGGANSGATYVDSQNGYTTGIDGVYTVASTPTATTMTIYQHGSSAVNTITPATTSNGAFFPSPPLINVTGITTGNGTIIKTGIGLDHIVVNNGGSNYTSTPTINISAPPTGGTQATAIAFESNGVVSYTIVSGGSCPSGTPTLYISGGGGGGAQGTVTLTGTTITAVTPVTQGNSYITAPQVQTIGGGCTGVRITANISGVIYGTYVTNQGSGYITPPTINFSGGGSPTTTATATAYMTTGNNYSVGDWVWLEQVQGCLSPTNIPLCYGLYQVTSASASQITLGSLNTTGATPYIAANPSNPASGTLIKYPYMTLTGSYDYWSINTSSFNSTYEDVAVGIGGHTYGNRPYDMQLDGNHTWTHPNDGIAQTCYDIAGTNKLVDNICDGPFLFAVRTWAQSNTVTGLEADFATFGIGNIAVCVRAELGSRVSYQGNDCHGAYGNNGYTTQCQGVACNIMADISTAYLDPSVYSLNNSFLWSGSPLNVQPSMSTYIGGGIYAVDFQNSLSGTNNITSFYMYDNFFSIISNTNSIGLEVANGNTISLSSNFITGFDYSNNGIVVGPTASMSFMGYGSINAEAYYASGVAMPQTSTSNLFTAAQTVCNATTNGYGLQIDPESTYVDIYGMKDCSYNKTEFYFPNTGGIFAIDSFIANAGLTVNGAAPTSSSGQIGYGGTTVAAGSGTCPSTSGVLGCEVHNIAGTNHNVPYY